MEELKMLYNVVGAMKREMDMLKTQLEQMQKTHDSRTKIEDEIVEWEQGQMVIPAAVSEVAEVEPELLDDTQKEVKLIDMERETIRQTLLKNNGNRKVTASILGLSERTLYRKIKDYGL
jgi:DNA-binding NtrC family response regulator